MFLIPLIGYIIYSNQTLPLQAFNDWCITHPLHAYVTYPSRCWVAWMINPPPPLGSNNGYAVDRGEKRLNWLQILSSPQFFQLTNIINRIIFLTFQLHNQLIIYFIVNTWEDKLLFPFTQLSGCSSSLMLSRPLTTTLAT